MNMSDESVIGHSSEPPVSGDLSSFRTLINALFESLEKDPVDADKLSPEELEEKATWLSTSLESVYENYMSFMIQRGRFEFASDLQIKSITVLNKLIDDAMLLLLQERLCVEKRRSLGRTLLYLKNEDQISGLSFIKRAVIVPEFTDAETRQNTLEEHAPLAVADFNERTLGGFQRKSENNDFCQKIRELDDFSSLAKKNLGVNYPRSILDEKLSADERRRKRRLIIAWSVVIPLFILCMFHLFAEYAAILL